MRGVVLALGGALLASCGGPDPAPVGAPAGTEAPSGSPPDVEAPRAVREGAADADAPAEELALPAPPEGLAEPVAERVEAALAAARAVPGDAAARLELAKVYDANALFAPAAEAYAQAARLDPELAPAWYHLGRCREVLGDWEGARDALERAVEAGAADYAPAHWRLAALHLDADRLDAAEAAARRVLELAPGDPTGAVFLARVHLQREEPGAAADVLLEARAARPDDGLLNTLLGRAWSELDDPRAAEALERAGEGTDAYFDPWRQEVQTREAGFLATIDRAKALLTEGRSAEALELALPLFEEEPTHVLLQGLVTAALVEQREFERALELLERARSLGPEHYRTEMNLGVVHHRSGDALRALPHLARALELNPGYVEGHAYLGRVNLELGQWDAAADALRRAVELGERDLSTRLRLGKALGNAERLEEAAEAFQRACAAYPEAPAAWGYLGAACADLGRVDAARGALGRLRRLDSEHPLVAEVARRIARAEEEEP